LYFWNKLRQLPLQLKDHLDQIFRSLPHFMPELAWAVTFLGLVVAELLLRRSRWQSQLVPILSWLFLGAGFVVLTFTLFQWNDGEGHLFHRLFFLDKQAILFKIGLLVSSMLVLAHLSLTRPALPPEFYVLLPAVMLGLFLMTMATHGLSIYLSIELVSVGLYLFVSLSKGAKPVEGGLKYLLFGAVSSGIMLYGLSLLYGMAATLDFTNEAFGVNLAQSMPWVVLVAGFLALSGLFFKLSLVPFHVWAPDVYEALPLPVAGFVSVLPKMAALLVLVRLLSALPTDFQTPMAVISLASILVGNTAALWQNDLRRLLAYSGVAQAGFMVVGLVAFSQAGFEATAFYVGVYVFMNLAAFLLVDLLGQGQTDLRQLAGLGAQQPFLAVAFVVAAVSLVGLPPTAGFMAKLLVFSALWDSYQTTPDGWLLALLILGLFNAVVSLAYYFKVPFYLFFRNVEANSALTVKPLGVAPYALVLLLILPLLALFFKPEWLLAWLGGV
jgi:NADH-quinone oxidoreductase subunit N